MPFAPATSMALIMSGALLLALAVYAVFTRRALARPPVLHGEEARLAAAVEAERVRELEAEASLLAVAGRDDDDERRRGQARQPEARPACSHAVE